MNYQPLDDRILIKPDAQEETRSGFLVAEENRLKKLSGTVVAVGTGIPLHNLKINITTDTNPNALAILKEIVDEIRNGRPLKVKVGDRVLYGQFAGTRIPLDGQEYLMLRESDVFMTEIP
jgi:chaperonin GroES